MSTKRIKQLEEQHVPKYFSGDGYVKPVYLSPERTRHYTESYKETEGEPTSIRRAKAFAHHLDNMRINIRPHELIIGNYADDPSVIPICMEASDPIVVNQYIDGGYIKEGDVEEWLGLLKYWEKHNLKAMIWPLLTQEEIALASAEQRYMEVLPTRYTSRTQPDHDLYLEVGVNKTIEMLRQKLEHLHKEKNTVTDGPKGIEITLKISDVQAMLMAAEAFLRWTNRYSQLAKRMAEDEKDPQRKKELMAISKISRTFWPSSSTFPMTF